MRMPKFQDHFASVNPDYKMKNGSDCTFQLNNTRPCKSKVKNGMNQALSVTVCLKVFQYMMYSERRARGTRYDNKPVRWEKKIIQ